MLGSVLVIARADGKTEVTVNAKAARAGVSLGMGIDAKTVQNKLVSRLTDKLGVDGLEQKC